MGIRVDEDTLRRQVAITGDEDRSTRVAQGFVKWSLPTHGGGIAHLVWLCSCFVRNISVKSKLVSGLNLSAMNMKISYMKERVEQSARPL